MLLDAGVIEKMPLLLAGAAPKILPVAAADDCTAGVPLAAPKMLPRPPVDCADPPKMLLVPSAAGGAEEEAANENAGSAAGPPKIEEVAAVEAGVVPPKIEEVAALEAEDPKMEPTALVPAPPVPKMEPNGMGSILCVFFFFSSSPSDNSDPEDSSALGAKHPSLSMKSLSDTFVGSPHWNVVGIAGSTVFATFTPFFGDSVRSIDSADVFFATPTVSFAGAGILTASSALKINAASGAAGVGAGAGTGATEVGAVGVGAGGAGALAEVVADVGLTGEGRGGLAAGTEEILLKSSPSVFVGP